jgi:hypothetical protein
MIKKKIENDLNQGIVRFNNTSSSSFSSSAIEMERMEDVPCYDISINISIHDIHHYFQLYPLLIFLERKDVGLNEKMRSLEGNDVTNERFISHSFRGFRLFHGLLMDW